MKTNVIEKAEVRNFEQPIEVRQFPNGQVELVRVAGRVVGKATLQPGWKWSTSLQPIMKTKSCEAAHLQYHVSGTIVVKMDDGTLLKCRAGDVSMLPPGHDAWVEGDEPAVLVDFQGMVEYAKHA